MSFLGILEYIVNPQKRNSTYFQSHSKIQRLIGEHFEVLRKKVETQLLAIEMSFLQNLVLHEGDVIKAKTLINLSKSYLTQQQLTEQDLDQAVNLMKEKERFDSLVIRSLDDTLTKHTKMIDKSLKQLEVDMHVQPTHYDISSTLKQAQLTVKQHEMSCEADSLFVKIQKEVADRKLVGLPKLPVRAIVDCGDHIVTGTSEGDVIGWIKPQFTVGFRIKCQSPLNTLCKVSSHEMDLLLTAGYVSPFYSNKKWAHLGIKLYVLYGHKQQVNKMIPFNQQLCLTASNDSSVQVWNPYKKSSILTMNHHKEAVMDITLLGRWLVSVGLDCSAYIVDPLSGHIFKHFTTRHPIHSVHTLTHDTILLGTNNGMVKAVPIHHGQKAHDITVCKSAIAAIASVSPNHVICSSVDGKLSFIRMNELSKIKHLVSESGSIAYIEHIFMAAENGVIKLFLK